MRTPAPTNSSLLLPPSPPSARPPASPHTHECVPVPRLAATALVRHRPDGTRAGPGARPQLNAAGRRLVQQAYRWPPRACCHQPTDPVRSVPAVMSYVMRCAMPCPAVLCCTVLCHTALWHCGPPPAAPHAPPSHPPRVTLTLTTTRHQQHTMAPHCSAAAFTLLASCYPASARMPPLWRSMCGRLSARTPATPGAACRTHRGATGRMVVPLPLPLPLSQALPLHRPVHPAHLTRGLRPCSPATSM